MTAVPGPGRSDLLQRALELGPAERDAFLADVCAGDGELEAELRGWPATRAPCARRVYSA